MRAFKWTALALFVAVSPAAAQNYPARPITFIVPYAAGGTTDVLARIVGKALGAELGQTIIIENVGGAGGTIGTQRVVRAESDGYTLTFGNMGSLAANVSLYPNLSFDPRKDLTPVGLTATVPMVLSASKKSAVGDLAAFLKKLREKDDAVNFGTSGPGSTGHLAAVMFLHVTKTKATLVTYRGAGPAINDLVAGVVDAVIDQTVTMIPQHTGGGVSSLAVSSKARLAQIPDVPTFAEAGVPEFDLTVWNAIAAPRSTPPAVIERLEKALGVALNDPDLKKRYAELAAEPPSPDSQGSEPLRKLIASDVERLGAIIKAAGLKGE